MLLKILYNFTFIISIAFNMISCNTTENESKVEAIVKTTRIYPSLTPAVHDSVLTIINYLFAKNGLPLSNLQVYRFDLEEPGHYIVGCYQYFNSHKLFTNDLLFHFKDDALNYLGGKLINELSINLSPTVQMEEASNLFYSIINSDSLLQKDSLQSFNNAGFNAELGIYDLNAGNGRVESVFVLAWKLTIAGKGKYPVAYIRADLLQLIYYDNGWRWMGMNLGVTDPEVAKTLYPIDERYEFKLEKIKCCQF